MKRKKPKGFTPKNYQQRQDEIYLKLRTAIESASSNPKGAVVMYPKSKHPDYVWAMRVLQMHDELEEFNYQFGKLDDEGTVICLKFTLANNSD